VAPGNATITEAVAPWYSVTSITQLPGQSYINTGTINLTNKPTTGTPALPAQSVQVAVASGSAVDAITYNDAIVTGYVEVCKATPTGSGLTGTFGFTLSSNLSSGAFATAKFAGTASATVGACSSPILVPAGTITTTENGTNLYVTSITADFNGVPANNALVPTPNLVTGTATANVNASADVSSQTDVYYTDNVVALKVCKLWSPSTATGPAGQLYTFTVTPGVNPAGQGPVPAPYTVSIQVNQCSTPVAYAPGTPVAVSEGVVPGTKVFDIETTGSASTVLTPATSLINRTTNIIMGNSVLGTTSTNEALVTYTNEIAAPGTLKVCKVAGTGLAPLGTTFNFTVVNGATTYNVAVPLGQCDFVVDSTGTPVLFPFNTTLLVTEAASTGNLAQAITVVPNPDVTESRGVTTELSKTNQNLGVISGASSANVTISENVVTEATWADIDPPIVTNPGNTGGSGVASTNGASGAASNNTPGSTNTNTVVNAGGILVVVPTVHASTTHVLTKAQTAKLAKLKKELASDKAQVKALSTKHFASKAAKTAAAKKINALKSQEKSLNRQIAAL
jgi:hypothetical protein